jgi:alcohol dehydrogenase
MQTEYIGERSLARVADIIAERNARKVALVVGQNSYAASGAQTVLEPMLAGLDVLRVESVAKLPLEEDIAALAVQLQKFASDLVLAVGGGHVMDIAKAANARATQAPLVAVPTTAGSGAESTPFAVAYQNGIKLSLEGPEFLPSYAIVDPLLAASTPRIPMLASALDALCQATESLWSVRATEESKKYAAEAQSLVWQNIVPALQGDRAALGELARGAHLAGKAIAISKTTACHAFSYGLTARFGVPHGIAVAIFLPAMMRFNAMSFEDITPRAVEMLIQKLNVPQYKVPTEELASLAVEVNVERLSNNPKTMTKEDIMSVYTNVWNRYLN